MVLLRERVAKENDIIIFSPSVSDKSDDYNATWLDILFEAEDTHFWFLVRKEKILSVFNRYIDPTGNIIEIGAGTGNVAHFLFQAGYNISVGEMHVHGLRYAQKYGVRECYQFDLFDPPFDHHFDCICMFDVLEHLDNDLSALQSCFSMLKTGGRIVLTVPAFNCLWSRYDAYGHKRRYTMKGLTQVVEKADFSILHGSYFFTAILPILILRHFMEPDDGSAILKDELGYKEIRINPFFNKLFLWLCRLENKIDRWASMVPGGSIILVAEKR